MVRINDGKPQPEDETEQEALAEIWKEAGLPEKEIEKLLQYMRNPDEKIGTHTVNDILCIANELFEDVERLEVEKN